MPILSIEIKLDSSSIIASVYEFNSMSQRVDHLAQNVKGETENMRTKFSTLQDNLRDLSSGGLFGQIDSMIQELKHLTELNEKYELRHFLTCAELERRALVTDETRKRLLQTEDSLQRCEQSLRDSERLREEDKTVLRRNFEYEMEAVRNAGLADKQRLERRILELQENLSRRDATIEELNRNLAGCQDLLTKTRLEGQTSLSRQADAQRQLEDRLKAMEADHIAQRRQLEAQMQAELENLHRRLDEEKTIEVEKQKRLVSEYYSQQLVTRDAEIQRLGQTLDGISKRLAEVERDNGGLRGQMDQKAREADQLRDQLVGLKRSFEDQSIKASESLRLAVQKAISEKEKEMRDKLDLELSRAEKELKEKKALVLSLEQKIIFVEKENQRNSARLTDMTVERDELKSKLIDSEKRLGEELRIVEETLTIQIQEQHGEINRLAIQNRELNESYALQLEQERNRANGAASEAEMLRHEILKLKELSERRNREIEEWRVKYKGYITAEE